MNSREQVAHDYIELFLDAAIQQRIGYMDVYQGTYDSLCAFRTRCPSCLGIVSHTDWSDQLRAAKCGRCGHGWKEASL